MYHSRKCILVFYFNRDTVSAISCCNKGIHQHISVVWILDYFVKGVVKTCFGFNNLSSYGTKISGSIIRYLVRRDDTSSDLAGYIFKNNQIIKEWSKRIISFFFSALIVIFFNFSRCFKQACYIQKFCCWERRIYLKKSQTFIYILYSREGNLPVFFESQERVSCILLELLDDIYLIKWF